MHEHRPPSEGENSQALFPPVPDAPAEPATRSADDLIAAIEVELGRAPEPHRAARLRYELAQCCEHRLGDLDRALAEYREALALAGDHLPSLRGACRVALALDRKSEAAELLAAEAEQTSDPAEAARVHHRLGQLCEDGLDDVAAARTAYEAARARCPGEPTYLKALERIYRRVEDWDALASVLEDRANAAGDPAHRAALTVERARLHETRLDDPAAAAELYQAALALMPDTPGVIEALIRLHRASDNVAGLVAALEQAEALVDDPRDRAELRYHRGRIQAARLGDRVAAIESLEAAVRDAPDDPLVLDAAAELHRKAGNRPRLAELLRQRIDVTVDPGERADLLHQLGQVLEAIDRPDAAIAAYQEAITLAPTCVPVLQALGTRLAERRDWEALVAMHRVEAEAAQSTRRRASAHRRMGELLERRLAQPAQAAAQYQQALTLEPGDPGSFKALVRLWAELGEHRKLIEIYERAVDETPSAPRKIAYLFKIGSLWEDAVDEPGQAIGAYARVLELAANDLGAIHALQRVCERAERYDDLVQNLLLEADLVADEALVLSLRQRAAEVLDEHLGDPDRARALLEQVLASDPGHLPAVIALGRIHYRAGRWRELLQMYERELAVTSDARDRAILLTRMGELCEQKLGSVDDAAAYYEQAAGDDPLYRPATAALLRLLTEAGDHDSLLQHLQARMDVLEGPAERARLAVQMAHLRDEDGDLHGAIEHCRAALADDPQYRPAARTLERLLEQAEAFEELEPLLASEAHGAADPRRAVVSALRRGELLRDPLHRPDRATEAYREARAAGAGMAALLPLAALHARTRDTGALVELETELAGAVEHRAERAAALREVIRLLSVQGRDDDDLLHACEALLELEPKDPDALLQIAELAARRGDRERLALALARLGRATDSDELAGDYWLRLAQLYEAAGDDRALAAYQSVLDKVPGSLAAARGLERAADLAFDAETRAFALRRQAALTGDGRAAAELLVASAEVDTSNERSIADLERALELWPDSARAAELLARLIGAEDRGRLIDLLSRAAGAARDLERRAALWHDVARAYADQDDLGAAIAAAKRGLMAVKDDLACLDALAALYARNEQWKEAIATLGTLAGSPSAPVGARRLALIEEAGLWERQLAKPDLALARARDALELEPLNRQTLALVARLENANGRAAEAEEIARDLLSVSIGAGDQADALCVLGEIEARRGDLAAAAATLARAVALTGIAGPAYATLHAMVADSGEWHVLAAALEEHLGGDHEVEDAAAAHQALATTYQTMKLPGKAMSALERGYVVTHDRELARSMGELMPQAGPPAAVIDKARSLLDRAPDEPSLWRALARSAAASDQAPLARRAVSALAALDAVQPGDEQLGAGDKPRIAAATPGSFDAVALDAAIPNGAGGRPVASLVAALAEALARVADVGHPAASLSRRDRVAPRSKHPLSPLLDRLAAATGVECELHVRAGVGRPVVVVLGDTPTVLVDEAVVGRPPAQQCFLLARPMVLATLGLHPIVGVAANVLEGFVRDVVDPDAADSELIRQLRKAVPRRQRKALDTAIAACAEQPEADFLGWRRDVLRGANRLASLLADDLGAAVTALGDVRDEGDPPPRPLPPSIAADLLRFWVSETALQLRRRGRF